MKNAITSLAPIASVMLLVLLTSACSSPSFEEYVSPSETALSSPKEETTELPSVAPDTTLTASPIPTSLPTMKPTVEPTPTPDWEAIATQIAELPDTEIWTESSPDGKWTAIGRMKTETGIILGEQELYYTQLIVASADQSVEWLLVEEISPFGLGYTIPAPLHWSTDGRYLYYTNRPRVDGCGLFVTASDLWRADLADGSVSRILVNEAQSYAFSPDGSLVAYITWSAPAELVLYELETSEERRTTLDFEDAGAMVWSPDGARIALTGANHPCLPDWKQAIMLIDASDLSQTTLMPPDERLLKTSAWQEAGKILLEDNQQNLWWLLVDSGEVTLIH